MGDPVKSLNAALRRLWADHVIWTRQYVVATVGDAPDAEAAGGRLLKNQEDIGGAIVPFYGSDAGQALTDLLKQHIMIAVDLIAAAKAATTRSQGRGCEVDPERGRDRRAVERREPELAQAGRCRPPGAASLAHQAGGGGQASKGLVRRRRGL